MKVLNSACMSGSATDQSFLADMKAAKYPDKYFEPGQGVKAQDQFILSHSMARVTYTILNFREKNMEKLEDKQFKISINSLLSNLMDSQPFFVRCLKPNHTKIPGDYEFKSVVTQLQSLSILDALQLAQKGYPTRETFADFLERFHLLSLRFNSTGETPVEELVDLLAKVGDLTPNDYQIGTTKVFLKKQPTRLLEGMQLRIIREGAEVCDQIVRVSTAHRVRFSYDDSLKKALAIQAHARGFMERLVILRRYRRKRALWGVCLW